MQGKLDRLRAILVVLLVLSAGLFAFGAAVERHHHTEASPAPHETSSEAGSQEGGAEGSGEASPTGEASPSGEASPAEGSPAEASPAEGSPETSRETLLGIDPDAPGIVAGGVALSIALAIAIWTLRRRPILFLTIALGLALTALDGRELVHQVQESRTSLIAVASILMAMHLLVAGTAVALVRVQRRMEAAV